MENVALCGVRKLCLCWCFVWLAILCQPGNVGAVAGRPPPGAEQPGEENNSNQRWYRPQASRPVCLTKRQCFDPDYSKVFQGKLFDTTVEKDMTWQTGTTLTTPSSKYSDYCKGESFLYEWACVKETVNGKTCYVPKAIPFFCGSVQRKCYDKDLENPAEKAPARCVIDLCPAEEDVGVQVKYPYASNFGSIKDTCSAPDACLYVEGIQDQTDIKYDLDGDGVPESCTFDEGPLDKCPKISEIQPSFLYDTNGDDIKDSCEPSDSDLCPFVTGVQDTYPYDSNGDGTMDSCEAPVEDLCPQTPTIDSGYLFDTNNDGVMDSCFEVSGNFCADPSPATTYPGSSLYVYGGKYHLGLCIDGQPDKVKHFNCQDNGTFTTDTTECVSPFVCQNGACEICHDPDGPENFATLTTVQVTNAGGMVTPYSDDCSGDYIRDWYCKSDDTIGFAVSNCPVGKFAVPSTPSNGIVTCACQPLCNDTDEDNKSDTFGTVTISVGPPYPDWCEGTKLYQFACSADGVKVEVPAYDCAAEGKLCKAGKCVDM